VKLDDVRKLHQKKYREELGYFLVEGEHLVLELQKAALQTPSLQNCELYVTGEYEQWRSAFTTHVISTIQMAQIAETRTPQGIVALVPLLPAATPQPGTRRTGAQSIYLYEIQDPGNLGTILRTLAWFGNFRCLLSPGSVDPYNSKVIRASMGAIFHVPLEIDVGLAALAARFAHVACLDMQGERVQSPRFKEFGCYMFGNEARGIPREQLAALNVQSFTIAGSGSIESLNLAAAVNMCVYELNRERANLRPPHAPGDVP
jgi:TrmH family RNA methyltransferase